MPRRAQASEGAILPLGDLPPEIFQQVIARYVNKVGVVKAWKSRGTCKTFADYIEAEVFKNQPLDAFRRSSSSRKLLEKGLFLYLEYHSNGPDHAMPGVPSYIKKTVEAISQYTKQTTAEEKRACLKSVCKVVLKYHEKAHRVLVTPSQDGPLIQKWVKECFGVEDNLMSIAILTERLDLVEILVQKGFPIWRKSKAFIPCHIACAVFTNNMDMLDQVLRYSAVSNGISMREKTKSVANVIRWDCRFLKPAMLSKLILWHCHHLDSPTPPSCLAFFSFAIRLQDRVVLKAVLNLKLTQYAKDLITKSYFRCMKYSSINKWTNSTKIVQKLIDKKIMIDQEIKPVHNPQFHMKPLEYAISLGKDSWILQLLANGASPEGIRDGSALTKAAMGGKLKIVELLVEYGANPAGDCDRDSKDCILDRCTGKSEIQKFLLRSIATEMKELDEIPDYLYCFPNDPWDRYRKELITMAFGKDLAPKYLKSTTKVYPSD